MQKLKIVAFTGAGISAESGLKTFRGDDGLWEGYRVEDVATPEAWNRNPEMVQKFYNLRRKQCINAQPNAAHKALVDLEKYHEVKIITQNIDDLHERAGSTFVVHLHGEIRKAQSSIQPDLIYPIEGDTIEMGKKCSMGSQLRPHVVWFGESVPKMVEAINLTKQADVLIVIGTSLQVYPAAQLVYETKETCKKYVIDPNTDLFNLPKNTTVINENATSGVGMVVEILTK